MVEERSLFSQEWHRVADLQVALRPQVNIQRQMYRGELWHVIQDPNANRFFRVRPEAYRFLSRLHPDHKLEQVWREALEAERGTAPSQDEVIRLVAQLNASGLLIAQGPLSQERLDTLRQQKHKQMRKQWLNILFFRIPLIDPQAALNRTAALNHLIVGPIGIILWLACIGYGVFSLAGRWPELGQQGAGALAPQNLIWLYLTLAVVKLLHEWAHAMVCHRFGGPVHTLGVMLLVFTPIPYMDATSAWAFRERWKRVLTGAAGMIMEVGLAGIAAGVWAATDDGLVHNLAFNVMFVASVSTVLFNLNPLLRFDGYYILSDLVDVPNLHKKATEQFRCRFETYLLHKRCPEAEWTLGGAGLSSFAIASAIYRVFIMVVIGLFIADQWFQIGRVIAVLFLGMALFGAVTKLPKYLRSLKTPYQTRARIVLTTGVAIAISTLLLLPLPNGVVADGLVEDRDRRVLSAGASGEVDAILKPHLARVTPGEPLLRLKNPLLSGQITILEARMDQIRLRKRMARSQDPSALSGLRESTKALQKRLNALIKEQQNLVLTSPIAGVWMAPNLDESTGAWISKGTSIGQIMPLKNWTVSTIIPQEDISDLFQQESLKASVRLPGKAKSTFKTSSMELVPAERVDLPSQALAWASNGKIQSDPSDPDGRRTLTPFYLLKGKLEGTSFHHWRRCQVRIERPWASAGHQWSRALLQMLQKRYRL